MIATCGICDWRLEDDRKVLVPVPQLVSGIPADDPLLIAMMDHLREAHPEKYAEWAAAEAFVHDLNEEDDPRVHKALQEENTGNLHNRKMAIRERAFDAQMEAGTTVEIKCMKTPFCNHPAGHFGFCREVQ